MVDSLVTTAQFVSNNAAQWMALGFGGTFGVGLLGKIAWDWLSKPKYCPMHNNLIETITEIKTNVTWLVNDYKKRNGVV
jgi:hypothetical protein